MRKISITLNVSVAWNFFYWVDLELQIIWEENGAVIVEILNCFLLEFCVFPSIIISVYILLHCFRDRSFNIIKPSNKKHAWFLLQDLLRHLLELFLVRFSYLCWSQIYWAFDSLNLIINTRRINLRLSYTVCLLANKY